MTSAHDHRAACTLLRFGDLPDHLVVRLGMEPSRALEDAVPSFDCVELEVLLVWAGGGPPIGAETRSVPLDQIEREAAGAGQKLQSLVEQLDSDPLPAVLGEVLWHGRRTTVAAEALVKAARAARLAASSPLAPQVTALEDDEA